MGPIAANMAKTIGEEHSYYGVLRVCMMAFIKGVPPIMAVEIGRRAVPGHVRPTYQDLNKLCRNKAQAAGGARPAAGAAA
jgi:chemotaxis protein MotA